jgi:hypothetical protein
MISDLRAEGTKLLNVYVEALSQYQSAVKALMDIGGTGTELYRGAFEVVAAAREKTSYAREALQSFREPKVSSATHY